MKLSRYEILKHKTLASQVQPQNNSLKIFIENFYFYAKVIVPVVILLFVLLDYLTFTKIFNFLPATFLDVYLYDANIANSAFLLIIAFFPLIGLVLVYMMSYMAVFFAVTILEIKNTKAKSLIKILKKLEDIIKNYLHINESRIWDIFIISVLFVIILLLFSWLTLTILRIFNEINSWTFLLISLAFPLFVAHFGTIRFIKYYISKNEYVQVNFGYLVTTTILYIGLIFFINRFCHMPELKMYLTLLLIPTIFSFQLLDSMIDEQSYNKNKSTKRSRSTIVLVFITVLIVLGTSSFHEQNKKVWTNKDQNATLTMNLFLNKNFLSTNNEIIEINNTNFVKQNLNQNFYHLVIDKNALYLPVSKEMKLYFTDFNDTNKTLIFAINKQFYKGQNYYRIVDVGNF